MNYRIVLVESEHTLNRLLDYRLSKLFSVDTFSNAVDALKSIRNDPPDLIISEVHYPGDEEKGDLMNGFGFLESLQDEITTRVIPFIFLTARVDEDSTTIGLRLGADDYITKPFDVERLIIRVSKLIERNAYNRGELNVNPSKQLRVFLAHAHEDKARVAKLFEKLQDSGCIPWMDEMNLVPGQDWQLEIQQAIKDSHVVLINLSKASTNKRGYVQKEIRTALNHSENEPEGAIFIIPVRLEECTVPSRLGQSQWVDLYKPNGYDKLLAGLKERCYALDLIPPIK